MKIKNIKSFIIIFVFIQNYYSIANDSLLFKNEKFAIHPKTGLIANFYLADFKSFEGSIDCGVFKSGNGFNISAMLFGEIPFQSNMHLSFGMGYINRTGNLIINSSFPSRDTSTGQVVVVSTENSLETSLGFLEIQPEIRYVLNEKFISGPLRFVGGFRIYFPLISSFVQKEKIISPENAVFIINNKRIRERNIASGDISSINKIGFGLSLGLENLLKISRKDYFTQQLLVDYNFSDFVKDANWRGLGLRFEFGLRFSFVKEFKTEKHQEIIPPQPPLPEPPIPIKDSVFVLEKSNEELKPSKISIKIKNPKFTLNVGKELLATLPLVNAVFFERNSAVIPSNYILENLPLPSLLSGDAVNIHNYVLVRIAEIVKKNQDAKLIIEGATSGKEQEPEGLSLAKKRAETVRDALIALGVEQNKIKIKANIMPTFISNQDYDEGKIENQRVDIIVLNAPLQEYVSLQKFVELKTNLDLHVDFENIPDTSILYMNSDFLDTSLQIEHSGKYEIHKTKRLEPNENFYKIDAKIKYKNNEFKDSLNFTLDTLKKNVVELELSNFEAILRFDYNSSVLSEDNKGLLKQLVDFLPTGSTIVIYGSTDALGTEKRNIQLESERSRVTEQFIRNISGNKFNIETSPAREKFPEDTPQGRFLNRSIKIKIKKQ